MVKKIDLDSLCNIIFPNVCGFLEMKKALIFQYIVSGCFNVIMVGEHSTGKTSFIKALKNLESDSITDDFESDFCSVVLTNDYVLIDQIDELMREEVINYLNSCKSEGANFFGTISALSGEFLDPNLVKEFNLVIYCNNLANKSLDKQIFNNLCKDFDNVRTGNNFNNFNFGVRDYLLNLRNKNVVISDKILGECSDFYLGIREKNSKFYKNSGNSFSVNYLKTILKLTSCFTKLRNSSKASISDFNLAKDFFLSIYTNIGIGWGEINYDIEVSFEGTSPEQSEVLEYLFPILIDILEKKNNFRIGEIITCLAENGVSYSRNLILDVMNILVEDDFLFKSNSGVYRFEK